MQELEALNGTVEKIIFQSNETGFAVFVLQARNKNSYTITGNLPSVTAGQELFLKGQWKFHAKFGKQFEVTEFQTALPTNIIGLKKYLGSGLIKGVGPSYAEKLVNYFGTQVLNVIEEFPERLNEVGGIGHKRASLITAAWKDQKDIANLMVFLQNKNIPTTHATKIYKQYKNESIDILEKNPYRLAEEIWGIGFKTADEIAQKMGLSFDSLERVSAGIIFTINNASSSGHLYVEIQKLKEKLVALLELNLEAHAEIIRQSFHNLYNTDKIKLVNYQSNNYITLPQFYGTEQAVTKYIKNLLQYPTTFNIDIDKIYHDLRTSNSSLYLNENQQKGVLSCLQNKITVITGGPGTGKTTLIKKLLETLDKEKISYKLAAPTGRAAKRIMESTGKFAATVHRLLEFDGVLKKFLHNESNSLKLDFLIVDEASMIDIFLALSILKALPYKAHLVLIGDIDQLPSVGAGNFLNDIIASEQVQVIRLTEIFRQAQDSLIVINAHKINKGEYPVTFDANSKKRDFGFIKEENAENITNHLKSLLFIELKKHNISIDNSIVLTPMNKGPVGTQSLNHILQQLLNPDDARTQYESVSRMGVTYKVNDKVMQIRNNYDKNVFNGDIGVITSISREDTMLIVNYGDNPVEYDFDELSELVLAYAISIHKSQGSEYGAVIIPIFMSHFMLLQRNLIYTGLTRAKKLCIFIGEPKALGMAIKNTKGYERITFLKQFLNGEL